MRKLLSVALALSVSCTALLASTAAVAEYPEKPVSFVVPWPPGDLEDILTRMIAEEFQKDYGVAAAVVNKPGGGGGPFPGAVEVAKAPADGYTVGSFLIEIPTVGPQIGIPELSPNPFEPLGNFFTYPFAIVASANAPYDDLDGLVEYAKENDLVLGHFGAKLIPTRVTLALAKEKGFEFGSDAAFDDLNCNTLASGDVDVMTTTLQQVLPCKDDLKIIATIGAERTPLTPDVPTVAELVPELNISLWNGLFVRTGTPQVARDKIIASAKKVVTSDAAKKLSAETGALLYWQDVEAANKQIEADLETLKVLDKVLEE